MSITTIDLGKLHGRIIEDEPGKYRLEHSPIKVPGFQRKQYIAFLEGIVEELKKEGEKAAALSKKIKADKAQKLQKAGTQSVSKQSHSGQAKKEEATTPPAKKPAVTNESAQDPEHSQSPPPQKSGSTDKAPKAGNVGEQKDNKKKNK